VLALTTVRSAVIDSFWRRSPQIRSDVSRKAAAADYLTRLREQSPFTFMDALYGPDNLHNRGRLVGGRVDGAGTSSAWILPSTPGEASPVLPIAPTPERPNGP
jgi:hypothetical protein